MLQIVPLQSASAGPYRDLTFPSYQPLLERFPDGTVAFGLNDGGEPVGLALASFSRERRVGEVRSIQVLPTYRQQHGGSHLMQRLEEAMVAEGIETLLATYSSTHASTPHLERIFERLSWEPPVAQMLVVKAHLERVWQSRWLKRVDLPSEYEIFMWTDLTDEDAASMRRRHAEVPWMAEDLIPFDYAEGCDPRTSLGLRYKGEVVGWVITHVIADDTVRYTCSYLRPDLQKMGRLIPVYESVMKRSEELGLTKGIWTVPYHHPRMVTFVTRWIAPFADSVGQTRSVTKRC